MGIACRGWAEDSEKDTAKGILGVSENEYNQKISDAIKMRISELYPESEIVKVKWIGSEKYEDKGDIKVWLENGTTIGVELKVSKKDGKGTKANPGQGYFSEKVNPNIRGYSEFDEQFGAKDKRYALIEYTINRKLKNKSDYDEVLRSIKKTAGDEWKKIKKDLADITNPGKEKYASYAVSELRNYLPEVNKMVKELMKGNNTYSEEESESELLYCVVKHFESKKQTVEFLDFTKMDKKITQVVQPSKSKYKISLLNKSGAEVLGFSVNWKNICQGGATPCFSVFLGPAYLGE